jgi:hypothetical protein
MVSRWAIHNRTHGRSSRADDFRSENAHLERIGEKARSIGPIGREMADTFISNVMPAATHSCAFAYQITACRKRRALRDSSVQERAAGSGLGLRQMMGCSPCAILARKRVRARLEAAVARCRRNRHSRHIQIPVFSSASVICRHLPIHLWAASLT